MIAPESKLHLRQRPHPIRPLRHAVIRQFACRFLALAGRGRACSARPPLPLALTPPCARRAKRRRRRRDGRPKGGAAEGVSGTAQPCSPPRCGDRRPPGSGPPWASEGSVAGWGHQWAAPPGSGEPAAGSRGRWWPDPRPAGRRDLRGRECEPREGQSRRPGQPQDRTCSGPRRVEPLGWGRRGLLGTGEFLCEGLVAKEAITWVSSLP